MNIAKIKDVDFVWQNYLASFQEEKVVIGSNHTLYAMYMVNLLEQCKNNGKSPIIFIAVPHVKGLEDISFRQLNNAEKKLNICFATCRMKNSSSKWEQKDYIHLSRLSQNKRKAFFDVAFERIHRENGETLESYIGRIIADEINFQKIIAKTKAREER